jgi:aryl-alcohol dehydrogenase-like predicted oxidoreductase
MLFRRLGRTNLKVSEISYGAARGNTQDQQQVIKTIHAALDAGINFIDTASGYDQGDSERVLGIALRGHEDVLVETKYCPYDSYLPEAVYNGSPQALIASVEESLRRLQRDHIDVLLGHGMRSLDTLERFTMDGCYAAMLRLREQGKVRYIGISELSEADGTHKVLQHAVPSGLFDVVMLTINLLLQTAIESVLPMCYRYDVGTVVMMPLNQASTASGLVSVPAALECVRRHISQGLLPVQPPYTDPGLFDFLLPYTIPEAGLRYVLAQRIGTCCVGMRTSAHLEANLSAIDPPYLDKGRVSQIERLFGRIDRQVR